MEKDPKPSFSFHPKKEEAKSSVPGRFSAREKQHAGKTSLEPLYDTTDRYRRVIKPMKVEDFLNS